jgi:hypothetical protein
MGQVSHAHCHKGKMDKTFNISADNDSWFDPSEPTAQSTTRRQHTPSQEKIMNRLAQLNIHTEGFVFDPNSGNSFKVNPSGLFILKSLQAHKSPETIAQEVSDEYDIPRDEAERDVSDFQTLLWTYQLL